jgi:hypothetical protein
MFYGWHMYCSKVKDLGVTRAVKSLSRVPCFNIPGIISSKYRTIRNCVKKLTKRFKDIHVEITFADVNEYDTAKDALDGIKKSSIRTAKRKKTVRKKRGVIGKGDG